MKKLIQNYKMKKMILSTYNALANEITEYGHKFIIN